MAEIIRAPTPHVQQQALDNTTLTAADIADGDLNINVGTAPLRPAEFVVLDIEQIAKDTTTPSPKNPGKPPFALKKRNP
jgi:hypothetical protein